MRHKSLIGLLLILVLILISLGNYIQKIKMHRVSNIIDISKPDTKPKYTIHIEVDKKRLSLIDRENEHVVKIYPIATGKASSPTPLGSFKIVDKAIWGEGFGSRWLGLDIPWGIYGIHGTNEPGSIGRNVSAGCIRMFNDHIEELYNIVPHNTKVLISDGLYGPFGSYFRTLRPGDRGADVLEVQKRLKQLGYYQADLDGIYGESMKRALVDFLKDEKMDLTDKITEDIYERLGIILMD
ncbi:MAG TPA: L,D-transpeptidase family protein [Tissierellaceae bacterium]|nr:L,D-transpeptidase family protein [Tissierellaceae bacterium]